MKQMRRAGRRYWTREEDEKLMQCLNGIQGKVNWNAVARTLGVERSGSSCSQRYNDHLAPGLDHTDFSEEEICKIETLLALHGKKWSFIGRQLPGRTANDVKNWYHKQVAKKARELNQADGGDAPPEQPAGGPTVGCYDQPFVNGGDGNQPFVNGGKGFGGYDEPLVNGGDDFGGYNHQFVKSGGFNQELVESADDGFAAVDDVIDDIDQYLNYSSTTDDLLIYNVDGLWDFNDQKFLNNGGGAGA